MFKSKIENISKFVTDYIESVKSTDVDNKQFQKELKKILKKSLKKYIKNRDIDKPKRPKTSFILFCDDERDNIKKDFPHYISRDIVTEQGKRWKELKDNNPERLKKYEELALIHKKRYLKSMEEYENREKDFSDDEEVDIDPKEEKRKLKEQKKIEKLKLKEKEKEEKLKIKNKEKEDKLLGKKVVLSKIKKEDVKKEDVKKEDIKKEDVKKEDIKKEDIKKEDIKKEDVKKEDVKKVISLEDSDSEEDNTELKKIDNKKVIPVEEDKKQYSFEIFCEKKTKKFKKQNPELTDDQIKKKIENKWKKLSEEKRQKYI
jgi:hypothetical protein